MAMTDAEEFEAVTLKAWRQRVESDLKGVTFEEALCRETAEGLMRKPLYDESDLAGSSGYPGLAPFVRGAQAMPINGLPWQLCPRYAEFGPRRLNEALRMDREGGADAFFFASDVWVRLGESPRDDGMGPKPTGVGLYGTDDFGVAFDDVDLDGVSLVFEPGANALPHAAIVCAYLAERGIEPETCSFRFGADPLGGMALDGRLPTTLEHSIEEMALLARHSRDHWPEALTIRVSSRTYFEAGAHSVQELGAMTATLVEYLRRLEPLGLTVEEIAAETELGLSLGNDVFSNIAKVRAARRLWSRVLELCGVTETISPFVHVESAKRGLSKIDPWVNILRVASATFSGIVAGADSITSRAYDGQIQDPSELGRRISRNTHHVLASESGLGDVLDPAGGSYYVERWTDELSRAAWAFFLEIEAEGGMAAAIRSGWLKAQVSESAALRRERIATRSVPITGVSEYPPPPEMRAEEPERVFEPRPAERHAIRSAVRADVADEQLKDPLEFDALVGLAAGGADLFEIGAKARREGPTSALCDGLDPQRDAEPFELLRARSSKLEPLPRALLLNLGRLAAHTPRTRFVSNFLSVGGISTVESPSLEGAGEERLRAALEAFVDAGSPPLVVICGPDAEWQSEGCGLEELAAVFTSAGVPSLWAAGAPPEDASRLEAAGLSGFLRQGMDVVAWLDEVISQFEARADGGAEA